MLKALSIAAFVIVCGIGPANADKAKVNWFNLPNIETWTARGNGHEYSLVLPNEDLTAKARVVADAGIAGRITEVHAWLGLGTAETVGFNGFSWGYSKIYPYGERKKHIDSTVDVRIPADKVRQAMLDACHAQIIRLREELTDEEIWAEDREIDIGINLHYGVGFSGPDNIFPSPWIYGPVHPAKLICLKYTPSETPAVGGVGTVPCDDPEVPNSWLELEPISGPMLGVCRLVVRYVLRTSCPNMDVKFRLWEEKSDRRSEVISVTSNNARLAGGTRVYDVANTPYAEIGKIRLEGVSPEFFSNPREYTMDCREGPLGEGLTLGEPGQGEPQGSTFGKLLEDLPDQNAAVRFEWPDTPMKKRY